MTGSSACSLKSRSYSDSLPGFFKRGQGYGEFVDDSTTERLDDTSADTQFKMPYEEKCDAESGPQKQRKSADGRVPPISVKDRRNSSGEHLTQISRLVSHAKPRSYNPNTLQNLLLSAYHSAISCMGTVLDGSVKVSDFQLAVCSIKEVPGLQTQNCGSGQVPSSLSIATVS